MVTKAVLIMQLLFCVASVELKAQWQPVFSISNHEIHGLYTSDNIVIAGGNQRKVLFSQDSGESWKNLSMQLPAGTETIQTLLSKGQNIWVSIPGFGIRRSEDEGQAWDWANMGLESLRVNALAIAEDKLYAATGAGVFTSTNQATSWQSLGLSDETIQTIALDESHVWAGTSEGELFFSKNRGKDWENLNIPVLHRPIQSIIIREGKVYIGTKGQGVFEFSIEGKSTKSMSQGLGSVYVHDLAWNDNQLWAATDAGLYFWDDGANKWTKRNTLEEEGFLSTYALSVGKHHVFAGTSHKGVVRSQDKGMHWEGGAKGAMQQNIQLLHKANEQLYAGIKHWVYATIDGKSWKKLTEFEGEINHIARFEDALWAATNAGIYRKSSDEWQWKLINNKIKANIIVALDNEIFAATSENGIFVSKNEGNTWNEVGLSPKNIKAFLVINNSLIAGTQEGIYHSEDRGGVWQNVLDNEEITVLKSQQNYCFAGTKTGLYVSSNGGKNWNPCTYDSDVYGIKNIIISDSITIIHDNAGRLFASYDYGQSWTPYELPVLGNITSLELFNGQLVAGTSDKGIWQHAQLPVNTKELVKEEISVYPNPASEKIFIRLPNAPSMYEVVLKDIFGRKVHKTKSSLPQIELDITHLPAGAYYLQIYGNGKEEVRRIIKQQ